MLLSELAERSGVSAASIKYYRREGLLPPGDRVTATRQAYGDRHLDRLRLITVLREEADAPIPAIRALVEILDDPERPLVDALEVAQAIAAGLPARPHGDDLPDDEAPQVRAAIRALGWPDVASGPRAALDAQLKAMRAAGMETGEELLVRYGRPLDEIAVGDLASMREPVEPADGGAARPVSRDVAVTRAVLGMVSYDRLLRTLRALALASRSLEQDSR